MHRNKLKLIIFIQSVTIYSLGLYIYLTRSGSPREADTNHRKDDESSTWKQSNTKNIETYRQLAVKYDRASIGSVEMYGLKVGMRRLDRLNMLMVGFDCHTTLKRERMRRALEMWHEFAPYSKISILSRSYCDLSSSLHSLVSRIYVDDGLLNREFLKEITASAAPYDVIIDLGELEQSTEHYAVDLWRFVRTGGYGVYFIENMGRTNSSLVYVQKLLSILAEPVTNGVRLVPKGFKPIAESLLSVNCFFNSCALFKR